MQPREKVFWFSIISRAFIIILQLIFNLLSPDHDADAFRSPRNSLEKTTIFDKLINYLLKGLMNWDSEYYLHIAKYGYTYENTLAFLPLYPMTIRVIGTVFTKVLFFLNQQSCYSIAAIFINCICFVKSSLIFFDLTNSIFNQKISYRSTILYCISPASIFFTAAYTESMFSYLTFYCMLATINKNSFVSLPIGLSTLVRSNGLTNLGFPVYGWLQNFFITFFQFFRDFGEKGGFFSGIKLLFSNFFKLFKMISVSIAPFSLLQTYNYILFCTDNLNPAVIKHVDEYGRKMGFLMPGKDFPVWCDHKIPIAYSFIQNKYWNVGFLNYYEVKQIPNFLLAFPVLFIMFDCISRYFIENKNEIISLKIFWQKIKDDELTDKIFPLPMFPFILHGLFLTVFCILFVHIQVSTRILGSASPLIYWYCGILMSNNVREDWEDVDNVHSKWRVFFMSGKKKTKIEKLILAYFLGYTIVGTFMFSNFLPWT